MNNDDDGDGGAPVQTKHPDSLFRPAGHTPLTDTETLGIMDSIGSFFLNEPVASVGYVLLLIVGTIASVVGITRSSAGLYEALGTGDRKQGVTMLIVLGAVMLGLVGVNFAVDAVQAYLRPSFQSFMHRKIIDRILRHNEEHFLDKPPLAYRNMISASTSSSYSIFSSILNTYIPNGILLAVVLFFLASFSPKSALLLTIAGAISTAVFTAGSDTIKASSSAVEDKIQKTQHEVFDVVSTLDTVVTRNQTHTELKSINAKIAEVAEKESDFLRQVDGFSYVSVAILTAAVIACIYLAVHDSDNTSAAATSASVMAVTLMLRVHGKINNVSMTTSNMLKHIGTFEEVAMPELDPNPPPLHDAFQPLKQNAQQEQQQQKNQKDQQDEVVMEMKDVSFTYAPRDVRGKSILSPTSVLEVNAVNDDDAQSSTVVEDKDTKPALEHFSWKVFGGINGLFGRSGAGKSTAGLLLTGLYSTYKGDIELFGTNIRDMSRFELRSNVGLSQQSMRVPNRSIRDTLVYGNGKVTEAELAAVWEPIQSAFDGRDLESMVGIDGTNLSTGQLQLLRIAAMQLSSQSILVLDEPVSGVDVNMRPMVLNIIRKLGESRKAVVLVTHDREVAALAARVKIIT